MSFFLANRSRSTAKLVLLRERDPLLDGRRRPSAPLLCVAARPSRHTRIYSPLRSATCSIYCAWLQCIGYSSVLAASTAPLMDSSLAPPSYCTTSVRKA